MSSFWNPLLSGHKSVSESEKAAFFGLNIEKRGDGEGRRRVLGLLTH